MSAVNTVNSVTAAATAATNAANTIATSSSAGSNNTAQAQQGLSGDFQNFLTLLTTQLQNQDPTAPMDTNEITQQIAMLSQVQQQIDTNTNLQQIVTALGASQTSEAVNYIGKQVDATGSPAQTELTGSQATLVYNLPAGASSATITITNAAGQTVFSAPGTTIAGRNQVQWDGTDSATGGVAPDGTYNFTVTAASSSGAITATAYTSGTVTAVDTQNGTSSLSLGGISVPMNNVQAVYAAGTNPGA